MTDFSNLGVTSDEVAAGVECVAVRKGFDCAAPGDEARLGAVTASSSTCATCIHWRRNAPAESRRSLERFGGDDFTRWGHCDRITHRIFDDRQRIDARAFTRDSEDYQSWLECRENFGCVDHEVAGLMAVPEPTCALWYWQYHALYVDLYDTELEAAEEAVAMSEAGSAFIAGVQLSDGQTFARDEWAAFAAEEERAMEGWKAEEAAERAAPKPKTKRVASPFGYHEQVVVPADYPAWVGRP